VGFGSVGAVFFLMRQPFRMLSENYTDLLNTGGRLFWWDFLFYALWVPITVAYFGWPAPRIGDQLLSWIFDLLKIAMSGYVGIAALDKVLTTTHRGRVR
jgi:hypothetical protein